MATQAELEAILEQRRLELRALRDKAAGLDAGPELDAIQAQRAALSAQQKITTRELEIATNQSPATGQYEGIDQNSGQYRYKNPVTGLSFLSATAPTEAQQQQSGQTIPAATPVTATEARPETAPPQVQVPAQAPPLADAIAPADANLPAVDTGTVPAAANASSSYTGAPAAVDTPLLTPAESIARAQVAAPAAVDAATFNANTNASVLTAIGVPPPVDPGIDPNQSAAETARLARGEAAAATATATAENNALAAAGNAIKEAAKDQRTLQQRYKQPGNQDWRVRLVLAEGATYLYKDPSNQLLKPLANSNGVIFPYTPAISTSYVANYDKYDLVHNNYRGYFYKNSAVNDVNITGTFTAQDTAEAQYLLAVIHFFRSATKMFYGKDPERGAPPPLVYLVGYGEWQFNGHPCLITNFNYNLPADVDYIRASAPNNYGENLLNRRNPTSGSSSFSQGAVATRLLNALLPKGAVPQNTTPNPNPTGIGTVNNTQRPTYVPTKMEIAITLLPVNTRSQVSQQFELKKFANGDLLKEGFW
jgi:hypothetical protein